LAVLAALILAVGVGVVAAVALHKSAKSAPAKVNSASMKVCGYTFENSALVDSLPVPSGAAATQPAPTQSVLPPVASGVDPDAGQIFLLTRDCGRGAVVTITPPGHVQLDRVLRTTNGNLFAIAITPLGQATIRAWVGGSLVGESAIGP
jgi:hypothetical protein